ncbi:MAG TPA: hypothetical protein VEI07_23770 [Planctomycetaceae bacterium]|nr:hypothetical protein [Planctomycetaceae bacterium]
MPVVSCQKCCQGFEPDPITRGHWVCPHCGKKNANLRRHYRAIADLCVIGLILSCAGFFFARGQFEFNLASVLLGPYCLLLLTTIIAIYRSQAPWASATIWCLVWAVFIVAFSFNVALQLARGRISVVALCIYALLFPYFFWLQWRASRAVASGPLPLEP